MLFEVRGRPETVVSRGAGPWVAADLPISAWCSEGTAGVHVSHIFGKLEVSGRVEAAAIGLRPGLADSLERNQGQPRFGPHASANDQGGHVGCEEGSLDSASTQIALRRCDAGLLSRSWA